MNNDNSVANKNWPTLVQFPIPAKVLVSVVILTMAVAMLGAFGQIIIHDIIPSFFTEQQSGYSDYAVDSNQYASEEDDQTSSSRGDLFSESPAQAEEVKKQAFYKTEQFVWALKWSHIHLFGMNMIFIFMGAITIFLNISLKSRTWLIVLPFAGVLVDIATMWLKGYISPTFFWLHIPGGGLFGIVFAIVSARAFWEMWWMQNNFAAN
ncbi:MAG: hypothetical protein JSV31_19425 [Desulfobacterales bacterium]|nr:MAG: hypothetical protein JSV31_19425 [Desulfobacterales bacterium]